MAAHAPVHAYELRPGPGKNRSGGVKILAEEIENAYRRPIYAPSTIAQRFPRAITAGYPQRSAWVGRASTQAGPPSRDARTIHISAPERDLRPEPALPQTGTHPAFAAIQRDCLTRPGLRSAVDGPVGQTFDRRIFHTGGDPAVLKVSHLTTRIRDVNATGVALLMRRITHYLHPGTTPDTFSGSRQDRLVHQLRLAHVKPQFFRDSFRRVTQRFLLWPSPTCFMRDVAKWRWHRVRP